VTLPQELNIMILGAQSSVGQSISKKLISLNHKITGTYRSKLTVNDKSNEVEWQKLDLGNLEGVLAFTSLVRDRSFNVVLNLIGKLSYFGGEESPSNVSLYFDTYITNHTILIRELLKSHNGQHLLFINLSSRAVTYGSNDMYYSEAKSAIHGLTKSLAKVYRDSEFVNVIPGLIKESSMYLSMPESVQSDHMRRAGGRLIELDEFADFVVDFICKKKTDSLRNPGVCVDLYVGPQYE